MAQDLANAIAATPATSDRQTFPSPESLTDSSHGDAIATNQSHNGHITKPAVCLAQSQGETLTTPTQSYKSGLALTQKSRYVTAQVLTHYTQKDITSDEIEAIAVVENILWARLTYNRTASIHADIFRSIRRQQLEEQARIEAEMDVTSVLRESASGLADAFDYCEFSSDHFICGSPNSSLNSLDNSPDTLDKSPNTPDIEVDSDENPMNPTYRVWLSWHFLGSFHQSPVDGTWIANPTYGRDFQRHATSDEAVTAIATAWDHAQLIRATATTAVNL